MSTSALHSIFSKSKRRADDGPDHHHEEPERRDHREPPGRAAAARFCGSVRSTQIKLFSFEHFAESSGFCTVHAKSFWLKWAREATQKRQFFPLARCSFSCFFTFPAALSSRDRYLAAEARCSTLEPVLLFPMHGEGRPPRRVFFTMSRCSSDGIVALQKQYFGNDGGLGQSRQRPNGISALLTD